VVVRETLLRLRGQVTPLEEEKLVLAVENRLDPGGQASQGRDGVPLRSRDQVSLVCDVLQRRPVDGPPGQHDSEADRERDAYEDDDPDRPEQPRTKPAAAHRHYRLDGDKLVAGAAHRPDPLRV